MGYTFFRRIVALIPAVALWLSPGTAAARHVAALDPGAVAMTATTAAAAAEADDDSPLVPGLDRLPDVDALAIDGRGIEAVLGSAGLGAAWRSSVGLDPIARAMTVDYGSGGDAVTGLLATVLAWKNVERTHAGVVHRLREIALDLNEARADERDRQIARSHADVHFRGTHALMQSVALDLFSGGDPQSEALLGLDGPALTDAQRTHELTSHTLEEMMERRRQAEADLLAAIAAHKAAIDELQRLESVHAELEEHATSLARTRSDLERAARASLPAAAEQFALASVPRETGLTPRALTAYIRAEQKMAELNPQCRISWRMVAAVSAVEGKHGTHGNRTLGIEGHADDPIVGIALDGTNTDNFGDVVASIPDTDGGRFDGDPVYDRAVGPLQFIPDTWARWGMDGDDDGEADPHDIDDAALSAAAYLCNYGSMRTWDRWNTAVFGYNHSVAYVHSVKASLDRMDQVRLPAIDEVRELEIPKPAGAWVPPPEPEPEPEEEAASAEAG